MGDRKPKGYWKNSDNYIREMENAIEMNNGDRPTANWLRNNGFHQIVGCAKLHGGLSSVLDSLLGKSSRRSRGYFNDINNFYAEVDRAISENDGKHPTQEWIRKNGYNSLPIVSKSFGLKFSEVLNERSSKLQHGFNYWKDPDNYFSELSRAIKENGGERPSSNWLAKNGYAGIVKNAKLHGENLPFILDRLCDDSVGKKPQGYWQDPDNFYMELEEAIKKNGGQRPKQVWLDQNGYRGITANAKHHAGNLTNVLDEYFQDDDNSDPLRSLLEEYVGGQDA